MDIDTKKSDGFAVSAAKYMERLLRPRRVRIIREMEHLLVSFRPAERAILYALSILLAASVFMMFTAINREATTPVPSRGGHLTEGIVGTPRFVNPLLATSDADRDMAALVYSGLMRARPDNTLIPDLAATYNIDAEGTHYTFTIREDARFHDETPVTAADVAFTIETAQNPLYKSVRRTDWEGVVVEVVDERTVRFALPHPYAPFIEAATVGILPKAAWENVSPEDFPFHIRNTHPVGTGPYVITDVKEDSRGAPERYTLHSFRAFTLGEPFIRKLTIQFFENEEDATKALRKGDVESLGGIAASDVESVAEDAEHTILTKPLPRIFAVFFNEGKNAVLADKAVRQALEVSVSREALIESIFHGFAVPGASPIPPGIFAKRTQASAYEDAAIEEHMERARTILEKAGWTLAPDATVRTKGKTELAFSISTADTPELSATAEHVAEVWRSLGAHVTVKIFSGGDLNTAVIRPRDYDALLFGEVVGRSADVYAFWHSSQRNDPGLNLALYANAKADKLLGEARKETDQEARERTLSEFEKVVKGDVPAVFLYAPEFIYAVPTRLMGVSLGSLTTPSERFLNIYEWHVETERVWKVFLDRP